MTPEEREALQEIAVDALNATYDYGREELGYIAYNNAVNRLLRAIKDIK